MDNFKRVTTQFQVYQGPGNIFHDGYNGAKCELKKGDKFKIDEEARSLVITPVNGFSREWYIINIMHHITISPTLEEKFSLISGMIRGEVKTRKQYDDENIIKTSKVLPKDTVAIGRAQFSNDFIPLKTFVFEGGKYKGDYKEIYSPLQLATYIYKNGYKMVDSKLKKIDKDSFDLIEYPYKY